MRTEAILHAVHNYTDIPETISTAIKSLFGVHNLEELSHVQKQKLRNSYNELFGKVGETDYHEQSKEYTLRYFPVNFFKIWTPLYDLLTKDQLQPDCTILELGCGPGSSTMGFIEFYRILACENPTMQFKLNFALVERESTFKDILKTIFEQYAVDFPCNLAVKINFFNEDLDTFFERGCKSRFDYIIESNVLNPNEKIYSSRLEQHCDSFCRFLNPHSSIILIEPGKEGLSDYLYRIKSNLTKNGLSIFSPCSCDNEVCKMLPLAKVKTGDISLISESRDINVFNEKKDRHYFEYVIIRNDSLRKHDRPQNNIPLCSLPSLIGKAVKFEAYILHSFDKGECFDLKLCDGSLINCAVYMHIPKRMLTTEFINLLSIGRGDYVRVKNAKVLSEREITCTLSTIIDIM